ncbi:MAG: SAF domain-containing protein [Actinomycetota bacterium]|nr:SAF domain-containing protein [Actinomycetota bacterium]
MTSPSVPARLVATLRAVRRAISWHRRMLAAGFAAAAVVVGLDVVAPPPPPTAPVVLAARDLRGGNVLRTDDLVVRRLPPDAVPAGAPAAPTAVVGRVLAGPVRRGEPITDVRVVDGPLARGYGDGLVAAPVRIADAAAVELLEVGDRVDVLAPDPTGARPTAVIVTRAPVAALPNRPPGADPETAGALVVLAVPSPEARQLAGHAVLGPLVVTLRE